jgi:hypothetical protein
MSLRSHFRKEAHAGNRYQAVGLMQVRTIAHGGLTEGDMAMAQIRAIKPNPRGSAPIL